MTLRKKTLLIIGLTLALLLLLIYFFSSKILLSGFLNLEEQYTRQNVDRAYALFAKMLTELEQDTRDWAWWDDTYAFMEDSNENYIKSNLSPLSVYEVADLDMVLFLRPDGRIIYEGLADSKQPKLVSIPQNIKDILFLNNKLTPPSENTDPICGLISLPQSPLLVCSEAILTTEIKGPSRGRTIFGRFLSDEELGYLTRLTNQTIELFNLKSEHLPQDVRQAFTSLNSQSPIHVEALSDDVIAGYILLMDFHQKSPYLLKIQNDRKIFHQGLSILNQRIYALIMIGLFFIVLTLLLLEKIVLSRISELHSGVRKIGIQADVTNRLNIGGSDELTNLGVAINRMLDALQSSVQQIQESEERFRILADTAPILIWMGGIDQKLYYFNKGWLEFRGRVSKQEAGLGWHEGLHPDDVSLWSKTFSSVFEHREGFTLEFRLKRHDGEFRWLLTRATPRFLKNGEFTGYIGACADITERKKTEEALKESEEMTRSIVETALDAVILIDAQDMIIGWNKQAEIIFGWLREEALHHPFSALILPLQHRETHQDRIREFVETGASQFLNRRIEITALHKDSREFPIEISIAPLKSGSSYLFSAFLRDITERKRLERMKDEFLSSVSHELRTPLTSLKEAVLNLSDVPGGKLTVEQTRMIEIAVRNADRLSRIINDILDLSRLKSGKTKFNPSSVDMIPLIQDSLQNFEAAVRNKQITVQFESPSTLPSVLAEDMMIVRVLNNLLENALRYSRKRIEVKADIFSDGMLSRQQYVRVCVSDDGEGLSEQEVSALFNKFVQFHRPVGGSGYKGTGLGLAISKEIIETHHGKIWAESTFGHGAHFYFTIPLCP
jgi:PAS domain S-box-containing protein